VFQSFVAEKRRRPSRRAVLSSVTSTLPTAVIVLQIGLFNRFGHYFKYIKEVNVCPLLIEVSTTLAASEPPPYITALK